MASVLSVIAFLILASIVGVFLYWEFFPKDIISYPAGNVFPVITKTVKAGGYLKYKLYYCKYTEDISTVYQTLVGHNIYTLAAIQRNIPTGCQTRIISDVYIPPTVPPDTYVLHLTVEYHPNPLRTVQYFVVTQPFQVTK